MITGTAEDKVEDIIKSENEINVKHPDKDGLMETLYANCGLSVALSKQFLNRFLVELLPNLFKYIEQTFSLGKTVKLDLEMFVLYLNNTHITVNQIGYDLTQTRVELYPANNSIGFHIKDSNVSATVDYTVYLDPPILTDKGTMDVGYNNLNIGEFLFTSSHV